MRKRLKRDVNQVNYDLRPFSGERGIRTPETLLTFTRFPGVPLQPLEHLSLAM